MTVARRVALLVAWRFSSPSRSPARPPTRARQRRRASSPSAPAASCSATRSRTRPLRRPVRARRQPGVPSTPRRPLRPAAAPKQGVDYSGTNVQEEGVDEPDLVKTNGRTLFAVANGRLNAVDVRTPRPRLLDSLKLAAASSHELLLHGDRLLVLSRGGYWAEPLPGIAARIAPFGRPSPSSPRSTSPSRAGCASSAR